MERDDLDQLLSGDEIVPSSGFVGRVMDAVHVEATALPAIPFPWSRALPGIVAIAVALASIVTGFVALARAGVESSTIATSLSPVPDATLGWLLIVVLLCTVPVALSLRITRGHS
jgi:hypothetical protein